MPVQFRPGPPNSSLMPEWGNGRPASLKSLWPQGRTGSSPVSGILSNLICCSIRYCANPAKSVTFEHGGLMYKIPEQPMRLVKERWYHRFFDRFSEMNSENVRVIFDGHTTDCRITYMGRITGVTPDGAARLSHSRDELDQLAGSMIARYSYVNRSKNEVIMLTPIQCSDGELLLTDGYAKFMVSIPATLADLEESKPTPEGS